MHPHVHCITIYHSHDMQHFFNYSKNGKNKTTLKQTVSKQGVKLLGLCKSRDLKIINKESRIKTKFYVNILIAEKMIS